MEKKSTSGLAVAGLVCGIIALVSSFVPLLNLLSFPFVLLAIIFGGIGVWQTVKGTKGGKGIAIAGLVLGIIALLVTAVMYGSAGAASDAAGKGQGDSGQAAQQSAQGTQGSEAQQPEAAQSGGEAADYQVTIGEARTVDDYQGNPAIVVAYTFVNNSDKAISPMAAVYAKAFQNGVQLDSAVVTDGVDSSNSMNEIKPGASVSYELAYELADASDVTVEVEELISFSDELLAEKTFSLS